LGIALIIGTSFAFQYRQNTDIARESNVDQQNPNISGLSKVILNALVTAAPEIIENRQIIDGRLLQELEENLRRQWVTRADGSSRLVIDLVLTRAMHEIRRALSAPGRGWEIIPLLRHNGHNDHDIVKAHNAVN
jgi:DNA-binding winged helix-turn-helix (wHTH) protein